MATLVFSAVGTALGGPFGGALGALVGNQIDRAVIGSPAREGPRLRELAVTTSSYGSVIPRHYGKVRASGTVIWATAPKEMKEKAGGSKGSPSITSYAYSISFAVALSSRPIEDIGRIWADGSLLRGARGDLKVGGEMRLYNGHGDQTPDPLIASDRGGACPAFRGLAYCVFESLQLAEFGNRIPSLTFEVISDNGEVSLSRIVDGLPVHVTSSVRLSGLVGFSDEGGPLSSSLAIIGQFYPTICEAHSGTIRLKEAKGNREPVRPLPEPAITAEQDGFGDAGGRLDRREPNGRDVLVGVRYYDLDRDYQAGLQRAGGRARSENDRILEFPGVMVASDARRLCDDLVQRSSGASDQLFWRMAELDPNLTPGEIVSVPGKTGFWRIESWEWRVGGIELELRRLAAGRRTIPSTDAGEFLPPRDALATPTLLAAFELPWDGTGTNNESIVYAAASSASDGWTGAALYVLEGEALQYLQPATPQRSVIGALAIPITSSPAVVLEMRSTIEVQLASASLTLISATPDGLSRGQNLALVGDELLQFLVAELIGPGRWRLTGLLRGRGGTEAAALSGTVAGALFVLIDDKPTRIEADKVLDSATRTLAAIGIADVEPATADIRNRGIARKPITPVHPRIAMQRDGSASLSWTRRSRGSWNWLDASDVPLNEESERYIVGVGGTASPAIGWQVDRPSLQLEVDTMARLRTQHGGEPVWVRQRGAFADSDPVLLWVVG